MAYDEGLTQRVEEVLGDRPDLVAKKMFGGVGFLLRGNMACGVNKDHLVVRVGPDNYDTALAQPHVREFDITGRPMKGWVLIEPAGYESDEDLQRWVQQGLDFALSLPSK
jgi:TfoX/Sxy family transcriptional regulator of competence genes